MKNVLHFSAHPILSAGFASMLAGREDFRLLGVTGEVDALRQRLKDEGPDLLVIEATGAITIDSLGWMVSGMSGKPAVLWMESLPGEFVAQAIRLGVRGVLSHASAIDTQIECFRRVLDGSVWLEREAGNQLIASRHVPLTRRERELMGLVAQGLRNKEIAWAMGVTEGTVKVYLSKLFLKVGATDRLELALIGLRNVAANHQRVAGPKGTECRDAKAVPYTMPDVLSVTDRNEAAA